MTLFERASTLHALPEQHVARAWLANKPTFQTSGTQQLRQYGGRDPDETRTHGAREANALREIRVATATSELTSVDDSELFPASLRKRSRCIGAHRESQLRLSLSAPIGLVCLVLLVSLGIHRLLAAMLRRLPRRRIRIRFL